MILIRIRGDRGIAGKVLENLLPHSLKENIVKSNGVKLN